MKSLARWERVTDCAMPPPTDRKVVRACVVAEATTATPFLSMCLVIANIFGVVVSSAKRANKSF